MAFFSVTGVVTTTQYLTGGHIGVIVTPDAGIITSASSTVEVENFQSTQANSLLVNGFIINSTTGLGAAVLLDSASSFNMTVGPSGLVQGVAVGALFGAVSTALTLNNAGTMMSTRSRAIDVFNSDGSMSVNLSNSGLIDGPLGAIRLDSGNGNVRIVNSGTIMTAAQTAITLNNVAGSFGAGFLHNTGTVVGTFRALDASAGSGVTVVFNSGLIDGHILLGGGQDEYEGGNGRQRGTVFGQGDADVLAGGLQSDRFDGGSGNDTLVGRGGDDRLDGGPDDDFLVGGDGNDSMDGGTGADILNGNVGDDTILGGTGNDVLVGQDGSDQLEGGDNDDTLDGGAGDDSLEGGDDNDILRGRNGEDDLAGGLGRDFLTGGQGADNFVFRALAETVVGANRDQILDFEQGADLIVVAGLTPGVFEFRGTAAFAPSGNPELRLNETASGSTIVQVDVDGNGTVDAEIRVGGVTGLTADDFVL
ncbi:calcium-binding protein [Antarctobacter sp.]|uniref:calcium-binding protein n=1 Tax=Antarctobacter sp. TaxID=1872577 RepID=UPI003A8EEB11